MNQYAWNKEHVESFPLHTEMRKYLFDISIKLFFFLFFLSRAQPVLDFWSRCQYQYNKIKNSDIDISADVL